MKMKNAGDVLITDFSSHLYNCNLGRCQRPYLVPLPNSEAMQLYAWFGDLEPVSVTMSAINRCGDDVPVEIETDCFLIAYNGFGWYGIFKGYPGITYSTFIAALRVDFGDDIFATYFSEEFTIAPPCDELKKISVCYPIDYNAEDINGIYIGQPKAGFSTSGISDLIYQHQYWVRDAAVISEAVRATYTSTATKNFATQMIRVFELRCEAVPGWYKEYLLGVYFRGNFSIDDIPTKVSELALENIYEDGDLWKPYVKIDKEYKGAFGCQLPLCEDPCVCVPPDITSLAAIMPDATTGVPYEYIMPFTGSLPMAIISSSLPGWLSVSVIDNTLEFTGTPIASGPFEVTLTIENDCGEFLLETQVEVFDCIPPEVSGLPLYPNAQIGVPYNFTITLTGATPMVLVVNIKPSWMVITLIGTNQVNFSGTPTNDVELTVDIEINNCSDANTLDVEFELEFADIEGPNVLIENNASSGVIEEVTPAFYLLEVGSSLPLTPGQNASGNHGGGNIDVMVRVSGAVFGKRLAWLKNGTAVILVTVGVPGWYSLNPLNTIVFAATDDMKIELID